MKVNTNLVFEGREDVRDIANVHWHVVQVVQRRTPQLLQPPAAESALHLVTTRDGAERRHPMNAWH